MIHRAAPPRHQRIAVLATVFALHAGLIALLLLHRSARVAPVVEPGAIAMIAIAAERPAAAKPPPPALPSKRAETFKPIEEFSIPTETESDAPAGALGICSTPGVVLDALLLDPVALAAIRNAPPETRSVADAVAMWNEGWSPVALAPDAPLAPARASIERSLAAVPDPCLDEPVAGPRLIPIPDEAGTRTIFLVFGSGNWTWRALLAPPAIAPADGAAPVPGGAL